MPRVRTKKAAFDTYHRGLRKPDPTSKSGFRVDKSKPEDEHDTLFCKKGETYYQWSFRYGGTHKSLTPPKPSQLIQSEFLSTVYGLNEQLEELSAEDGDDLGSQIEEIKGEAESLRDETQDKLDSMPDHLQDSSDSGMLLASRVESLDEMISELENIDYSEAEISEDNLSDHVDEDELAEMSEEEKAERLAELVQEKVSEIISGLPQYEGE